MNFYINYKQDLKVKYPFVGSNQIDTSYSQVLQDVFILSLLKGKQNGLYFEIGAGNPQFISNTYLLSTKFGWQGLSLDCVEEYQHSWAQHRSNDKFVLCDALTVDYQQLLDENYNGQTVLDYLQCDIEPSVNTLTALKRLPHEQYRFRIITFETDLYAGGDSVWVRDESRQFLSNLGYELIVPDVVVGHVNPFEDWWVAPELVDSSIANSIKLNAQHTRDPVELLLE